MSEQELMRYVSSVEKLLNQAKALIALDAMELERVNMRLTIERVNIRLAVEKLNDALQVLEGLRATSP